MDSAGRWRPDKQTLKRLQDAIPNPSPPLTAQAQLASRLLRSRQILQNVC